MTSPRTHRRLRVSISMTCLALMAAAPAMAVSMKTSEDGVGEFGHGSNIKPCGIYTMSAVGDGSQHDAAFRRQTPERTTLANGQAQQAQPTQPVLRLKIGYSATWVIKGGSPLEVQFCVKPTIQNIGSAPWTLPFVLLMKDMRSQAENPAEDPNGQSQGKAIFNPHVHHLFQEASVQVPLLGGPPVPIVTQDWCGRSVKWYQRPRLVIVSKGAGMDNSCSVEFGLPLPGARTGPARKE